MDYSQPFSVLNEQLRPRLTSSEQLHSSLCRLEDRKLDSSSMRTKYMLYRSSILPTETEPQTSISNTEDADQHQTSTEQEGLGFSSTEEGLSSDLLPYINSCFNRDFNIKDEDEDGQANDNSSMTQSEETDSSGEMGSEEARDSVKTGAGAEAGESPFQRFYADKTLPDLISTGRPLGRRRTLTHVSDTVRCKDF